MLRKTLLIASLMGATMVGYSGISAAYDADNAMLASVGEFEVGNGDIQTVAHHKKDHTIRVCMRQGSNAVPLKVIYDGKDQLVARGNCSDFEAMDIQVTPAAKLGPDEVLIGQYERVRE